MPALREASRRDIARLAKLNAAASSYPWPARQFSFGTEQIWLAETDDKLQGFIVFSQVMEVASILNIAVHPNYQRSGIAARLLTEALQFMVQQGAERCVLEVRSSNGGAVALYEGFGFDVDATRKNYYPAAVGREDALLMSKNFPCATKTGSCQ